MKLGRTLTELAQEIERQAEVKRDFVASTKDMKIVGANGGDIDTVVKLELGGKQGELLDIGETAHSQIAEQAGIPLAYYRRMLAEEPKLLAQNVNTWFEDKPETRMLRTLDGKARALRSDKFRPLDHYELLEAALPSLQSANLEIVSCDVDERRMYVKAVDRAIQRHIPNGFRMGDGSHKFFKVPSGEVIPAIQISNSEIGYGSLSVVGGSLDQGCTNLMWQFKERGLRKNHVGARLDVGEELYKVLSTEARSATDKAIWLQFRDAVKAAISEEGFDALVQSLVEAATERLEGDPVKIVEVTAKRFALSDGTRTSVLRHLIEGGDLSRFGLANAVTSAANDAEFYELATDLETVGGKIIELPKHEWKELAKAA
jgi:hypothetical protein